MILTKNSESATPPPLLDEAPTVFIFVTPRYWRWRAKTHGEVVAVGSGLFPRAVPLRYALQFTKIKAQRWLLENGTADAAIEIDRGAA